MLFAADMNPYRWGPDIDVASGPVLPLDAHDTGRAPVYANPCRCGTRRRVPRTCRRAPVDATGGSWSAQSGDLEYAATSTC